MTTYADTIITAANVFTADRDHPTARAVAVSGKHIAYVGDDLGAKEWMGTDTRLIDGQRLHPDARDH